MASDYTSNYQLPIWAPEDSFLRSEFNDAHQKIDTALKHMATKTELTEVETTAKSKARVITGSYDGTDETVNINLGFQPSAVLIFTSEGQTYTGGTFGGLMTPSMPLKCNNSSLIAGKVTATGFTVYGRNVSGNYLSSSNRSYYYLAFQW